jgi:hypothetical protein
LEDEDLTEGTVLRTCEALLAGNYAQILMDLTPQAMTKLSQSLTQGGVQMGGPLPKLTAYEIVSRAQEGDEHFYDVRFSGDVRLGVRARWKAIDNSWKLVDFEPYQP